MSETNRSESRRRRVTAREAVLASGDYDIDFKGLIVPVRFRRAERPSNSMVVLFHGPLNPNQQSYPHFASFVPDLPSAHQLSIADTTLATDSTLNVGWYLGTDAFPLQKRLPSFLLHVQRLLGASRRFYVGESSGGFAALFYGSRDRGSIIVAANPHVDLSSHETQEMEQVRRLAWPSSSDLHALGAHTCLDISAIYSDTPPHRVIYVQSRGDEVGLETHFCAFMRSANFHTGRLLLDVGYWGVPGHSGSIPKDAYHAWARVAARNPTLQLDEMIPIHHRTTFKRVPQRLSADRLPAAPSAQDIDKADLLARALLEGPTGSVDSK